MITASFPAQPSRTDGGSSARPHTPRIRTVCRTTIPRLRYHRCWALRPMRVSTFGQSLYREPLHPRAGVTSPRHGSEPVSPSIALALSLPTSSCAGPLPQPRVSPCASGLCRLLRAPAGDRPFPTLSLRIVLSVLGHLPRLLSWCSYPFLPTRRRPSRNPQPVGASEKNLYGNFCRGGFLGAAAIRSSSGPLICLPLRLLPP